MLTLGTPEQFRQAGDFLRAEYTEEVVAQALGVPRVGMFDVRDPHRPIANTLVRLLFGGAAVPEEEVRKAVPEKAGEAMLALGLLERHGGRVFSPVLVYPSFGVILISDRFYSPEGQELEGDREFVYFALTENTQNYVATLPEKNCEAFLDVGAGCGAAAFAQSRHARHTWSADISSRCSLYAEFGRRLNGLENTSVVEGSLYEPVRGLQFDRIGCHPPYDISLSSKWTFADGGDDGEFVIRGVIQGLPEFLSPGGRFLGLARVGERPDEPVERKVRRWLGAEEHEFDVLIVEREISTLENYALASILSTSHRFEDYDEYLRRFEQLGVTQLVYCHFLVERRAGSGPELTLRRQLAERCTWREMDWLLDLERAAPGLDISTRRIGLSPAASLTVSHAVSGGEFAPAGFSFSVAAPFRMRFDCPGWVARLASCFSGGKTGSEAYALIRQHEGIQPLEFANLVKQLLSAGVLRIED
jgi:hypothetical protein